MPQNLEKLLPNFTNIVDQLGDSVLVIDINGRVVWANREFCTLMGIPAFEVCQGESFEDMIVTEQEGEQPTLDLMHALHNKRQRCLEICRKRPNGQIIWTEVLTQPLKDRAGQVRFFLLNERDITQRKRKELEREKNLVDLYRVLLESTQHEATSYPFAMNPLESDRD